MSAQIGRIVRPADFQRVLKAPWRARTAHFAMHYLAGAPQQRKSPPQAPVVPELSPELSTGDVAPAVRTVEDCGRWLGLVVPKRHARRAVTRNLFKRQIRQAFSVRAASLPGGLWVVRLKAPFDPARYVSAASSALSQDARSELAVLFDRAISPQPARG